MPEKSRLRELIDTYVMAGRGKVEIDQLLTDLEQRAATAKAMGAYEAGRDHGPAITELVATLHGTRGALSNLVGAVLADKQARTRRPIAAAVASAQDMLKRQPPADTPETVAEKAKAARAIGDRFAELMKGGR